MWFKFTRYNDDDELQEFFVFFEFPELEAETKEERQKLLKQFPFLKVKLSNLNNKRIETFRVLFPEAKWNSEKIGFKIDKNPSNKIKIEEFIKNDNKYVEAKNKEITEEIKLLQNKELKQALPPVDEFSKDLQNRLNKPKSNKFKR